MISYLYYCNHNNIIIPITLISLLSNAKWIIFRVISVPGDDDPVFTVSESATKSLCFPYVGSPSDVMPLVVDQDSGKEIYVPPCF